MKNSEIQLFYRVDTLINRLQQFVSFQCPRGNPYHPLWYKFFHRNLFRTNV